MKRCPVGYGGNSANVLAALDLCKQTNIRSIGFTGGTGGKMAKEVDFLLNVGGTKDTARIQEAHAVVMHQAQQRGAVLEPVAAPQRVGFVLGQAQVVLDVQAHRDMQLGHRRVRGVVQRVVEVEQPDQWLRIIVP